MCAVACETGSRRPLISRAALRLVVLPLLGVLALAGCTQHQQNTLTDSTPSPSTDPAAVEAQQKALAAYDGYNNAYMKAAQTGDTQSPDLRKYMADPLLSDSLMGLDTYKQAGVVMQGTMTWQAKVTAVNVTNPPYTVTIDSCMDISKWNAVFKATGKSAAASQQALKFTQHALAVKYDDGTWRITQATADRSRSC